MYTRVGRIFAGHTRRRACFSATTKAKKSYAQAEFCEGDFLVFGRETRGLPESLLAEHQEACIRIPMRREARSLNLSNSVAIVAYEALRQLGFPWPCRGKRLYSARMARLRVGGNPISIFSV